MKVSQAYPSRWLKAEDIGERRKVRCTIKEVVMETISDEDKMVAYFNGKSKGLMVNKTNAGRLAAAYGDETDDWRGKEIYLYVERVQFQGRMVPGIRVDVPRVEATFEPEPEPEPPPVFAEDDSEIPF